MPHRQKINTPTVITVIVITATLPSENLRPAQRAKIPSPGKNSNTASRSERNGLSLRERRLVAPSSSQTTKKNPFLIVFAFQKKNNFSASIMSK